MKQNAAHRKFPLYRDVEEGSQGATMVLTAGCSAALTACATAARLAASRDGRSRWADPRGDTCVMSVGLRGIGDQKREGRGSR